MARFRSGEQIREVVRGDDAVAYVDAQRELFAAGWTRIADAHPEALRAPDLEAALRETPDDDQLWLIYADFLIEHGDPRGAIVAVDSAPVRNIVERAARDAESRRLRQAAAERLGRGLVGRHGLSLHWRRGFIEHAAILGQFETGEAEDLLFDLLHHPCAQFLRELVLRYAHPEAQDHRLVAAMLATSRVPLRTLEIDHPTMTGADLPRLGDVAALARVFPALEALRLVADATTRFDGIALPRCRELAFDTTGLAPETLRDSTCTLADLAFIHALPRLARLRVPFAPFANELVGALVASPRASQLALLDLASSPFDDRGAAELLAHRDRFPASFTLVVRDTRISAEMWHALADADIDLGRDW